MFTTLPLSASLPVETEMEMFVLISVFISCLFLSSIFLLEQVICQEKAFQLLCKTSSLVFMWIRSFLVAVCLQAEWMGDAFTLRIIIRTDVLLPSAATVKLYTWGEEMSCRWTSHLLTQTPLTSRLVSDHTDHEQTKPTPLHYTFHRKTLLLL